MAVKKMKDLIGHTETFTGVIGQRASKRYTNELVLCLFAIKFRNVIIAHHSWVECGDNFKDMKEGDVVEFKATVIVYNKHSKDKKYGFSPPREVRRKDVKK